eukprot:9500670-Pyramimonas_sp.AAC.1
MHGISYSKLGCRLNGQPIGCRPFKGSLHAVQNLFAIVWFDALNPYGPYTYIYEEGGCEGRVGCSINGAS